MCINEPYLCENDQYHENRQSRLTDTAVFVVNPNCSAASKVKNPLTFSPTLRILKSEFFRKTN
jgi:hypothetical protein